MTYEFDKKMRHEITTMDIEEPLRAMIAKMVAKTSGGKMIDFPKSTDEMNGAQWALVRDIEDELSGMIARFVAQCEMIDEE